MAKKESNSKVNTEKFCPNCGAPVDGSKPNCSYCGAFLPGIASVLNDREEKDANRTLKRVMVNDVLGFLNEKKRMNIEEFKTIREEREKKAKHDSRIAVIGMIIWFLFFLILGIVLYTVNH